MMQGGPLTRLLLRSAASDLAPPPLHKNPESPGDGALIPLGVFVPLTPRMIAVVPYIRRA
jgi:hypothetical protein